MVIATEKCFDVSMREIPAYSPYSHGRNVVVKCGGTACGVKPKLVAGHGTVVQIPCISIIFVYKQAQQYSRIHQLGFIKSVSWGTPRRTVVI